MNGEARVKPFGNAIAETRPLHDALARMPGAWAKRRLIVEGPTRPGTSAARMAAIAIAAELRIQGVSEADVLAYVTSRLELFETGSTVGRQLARQLERSVRFAYHPPNGEPILSGCCRDPRPRAGGAATGALRASFEPYCDEECKRVCPLLRTILNPDRSLHGTPYEALEGSSLWLQGGGLGEVGRVATQLIAAKALALSTTDVQASSRYLCLKSGGRWSARHFRRALAALDRHELISLLDKRTGLRRLLPRDQEWIESLEARTGVAGKRAAHIAEARKESDGYLDWLADEAAKRGVLDAWDVQKCPNRTTRV